MAVAEQSVPKPIYAKVADALRTLILKGGLAPGHALDSESRLCRRFGASRYPVRQALANLETEGLIVRLPGKGTFVAARSLSRRAVDQPAQIGVYVDGIDLEALIFAEMIAGLREPEFRLPPAFRLSYEFHSFAVDGSRFAEDCLRRVEMAGCLFISFSPQSVAFLGRLKPRSKPVVSFFRHIPAARISQFYIDQEDGSYRAVRRLIGLGHRRIGILLAAPVTVPPANERLQGYRRALAEAGLKVDPAMVAQANPTVLDSIRRSTHDLLQPAAGITALVCGGRALAGGCLQVIHGLGLRIPQDLSLIGIDDTPEAAAHNPPLTVVRQPLARGVRMALEELIHEIENPGFAPVEVAVKPELVVRASCSAPGVARSKRRTSARR